VAHLLEEGRLHAIAGAPSFKRRVYVVENAQAVRNWSWYETAIASVMR
jgi:hypothetical protein